MFSDDYEDFPVLSLPSKSDKRISNISNKVVSFSNKTESCCVCYVDIVGSTRTAYSIKEKEKLEQYYEIYLNSLGHIIENHGGKIIKHGGDSLLYYFSQSLNDEDNNDKSEQENILEKTLECAAVMIEAHPSLNEKMLEKNLPVLNYRISADYGPLQVGKSPGSDIVDFFGSAINLCCKINSKATKNGIIIGNNLFQLVKSFDKFNFDSKGEFPVDDNSDYKIYSVTSKEKISLNPFERRTKK
jgi:class 3 adenylate cyclase